MSMVTVESLQRTSKSPGIEFQDFIQQHGRCITARRPPTMMVKSEGFKPGEKERQGFDAGDLFQFPAPNEILKILRQSLPL
eukprot:scaffold17205_cov186-Amphora_coffeaeformis.AAC.9